VVVTASSERALNRAVLARQLLLERAELPPARVLERVGGIQAQYAPSMYVGLWSRMAGLQRDALNCALDDRSVIQATLMRTTIHLVSREDYWPLALAVRDVRRAGWLRARKDQTEKQLAKAAGAVQRALEGGGTITRKELDALVGKELALGAGLWVDLVRVPPSGTWARRRADLFGLAEDWVGPCSGTVEEGRALLVRRYVEGFGPATRQDVQSFTGLPIRDIPLDGLEDVGDGLLDVPGAPRPDPDLPAPVRYLPTWDATLLTHCRRAGVLQEDDRARIFSAKTPHSFPTFLVDGVAAGTWRFADGAITRAAWRALSRAVERELDAEAERLLALHI
jgi:hypothetical protein